MASDEDFLQQNANKFLSEVNNFHIADNDPVKKSALKTALFDKLKEYDNEFYKRFNKVPLSELANQFTQQQNFRDLPDQQSIQENLMRNTFVSDAGYLTRYQRLHKTTTQNPITQPLNVVAPEAAPERNYEQEFINSKFNYKDTNLNQKAYLSNPNLKIQQINFRGGDFELNQLDSNKYQQDLLALMKQPQIVDTQEQGTILHHKQKIEQLGGIEDTIAVMENSLNELQNQTQHTRTYINNQSSRQQNFQKSNNNNQGDYFLKEYTQNQKEGNVNQVIERSKQLREQMLKKIQQN